MAGNIPFVNFVTNQGNNFRVTHQQDVVPKLPGYLLGYAHTSPEYWIFNSSNNSPVAANDIKVSSGAVNFAGNCGTLGSSVSNHLWYFNNISACGGDALEV